MLQAHVVTLHAKAELASVLVTLGDSEKAVPLYEDVRLDVADAIHMCSCRHSLKVWCLKVVTGRAAQLGELHLTTLDAQVRGQRYLCPRQATILWPCAKEQTTQNRFHCGADLLLWA